MRSLRVIRWGAAVLLGVYVVMHVAAIWTESINWDELALLARAEKAARTGVLDGAGRPGLAVAMLAPLVDGCDSTIAVIHRVRLLWVLFTLGVFAGTFFFVRAAAHRTSLSTYDALLGLAAFMLVPVVMRWSVQVRTDQPAIACAIWGGVALLASRRCPALALLAGFSIGVGYLFSQKAVYIGALVVLVAAADVLIDGDLQMRRSVLRTCVLAVGVALALALYRLLVDHAFQAPATPVSLERGLDLFRWYRKIVGYQVYESMLPTLWPMIGLVVLVVHGFSLSLQERGVALRVSTLALATLAAGLAVAMFHAAAFPYFAVTLGVFAATAIGIGWSSIRTRSPRAAMLGAGVALVAMIVPAIPYRLELRADTQAVQRTTLDVADALPRDLRGFHPDGALVCRRDPDPIRVYLRETVEAVFSTRVAEVNSRRFIDDFRTRPVAFIVRTHRFQQFPRVIQDFWDTNYLPYAGTLALAGQRVRGTAGSAHELDMLVTASYRWFPAHRERLEIGGRILTANEAIALTAGVNRATLLDEGSGELVIALDIPRAPANVGFYAETQLREIAGDRTEWW